MTLAALTTTVPAVADLYAGLSPAAVQRLDRLRHHVVGQPADVVERMVEQAFRNFVGVDTGRVVRVLTETSPAVA